MDVWNVLLYGWLLWGFQVNFYVDSMAYHARFYLMVYGTHSHMLWAYFHMLSGIFNGEIISKSIAVCPSQYDHIWTVQCWNERHLFSCTEIDTYIMQLVCDTLSTYFTRNAVITIALYIYGQFPLFSILIMCDGLACYRYFIPTLCIDFFNAEYSVKQVRHISYIIVSEYL